MYEKKKQANRQTLLLGFAYVISLTISISYRWFSSKFTPIQNTLSLTRGTTVMNIVELELSLLWVWASKTSLTHHFFDMLVTSLESERSCICILIVSIFPFNNFSIGYWNSSDSVFFVYLLFFFFHTYVNTFAWKFEINLPICVER
jgi:hypothetical protein